MSFAIIYLANNNEFIITVTELNAIASAAKIGRKLYMLTVKIGISAPAAIGINIIL